MRIPGARRVLRRDERQRVDESSGVQRDVLRMAGFRMVETSTVDIRKQPVQEDNTALQAAGGAFYFLLGYSALAGSDGTGDVLG